MIALGPVVLSMLIVGVAALGAVGRRGWRGAPAESGWSRRACSARASIPMSRVVAVARMHAQRR
ncbi:MAG: hypothetical protein ACK5KO_02000 [Arachnia sp.]